MTRCAIVLLSTGLWICLGLGCAHLNHTVPTATQAVSRSSTEQPSSSRTLRVMTYNVHLESAAAIIKAIENNSRLRSADLLFLQEIEAHLQEGSNRAEQVATALAMNFAYAPGYGLPGGGSHGVAILSRYPLREIEVIELPYYHVVVNSARRVAIAATLTLAGKDLRVYSVHLDNRISPTKRKKQLAPVFRAAALFDGPAIIAGDLNTSPFCWAFALLPIPCGLQDNAAEQSARKNGFQTPVANSGATSKWLSMKLDAIYVRGLEPGKSAVEHSVRLSDHLPLWLDLELPTPRVVQGPRSPKP